MVEENTTPPNEGAAPKVIRAGMQVVGGAVPFAGGLFSAAAGAWSENEQANFIPKTPQRRPKGSGPKPITSAFDDDDLYELTELGKQFVHYAMTDLPLKIESQPSHRKRMKTIENQGFLANPHAMGRSVPVKTASKFQIVNKINGFVHDSYGTALKLNINRKEIRNS